MRAPLTGRREILAAGALRVLDATAGWLLRCEAGRLWITEAGCDLDIVLHAGEEHRVRGDGKLLVEAASDAPATLTWLATSVGARSLHVMDAAEA